MAKTGIEQTESEFDFIIYQIKKTIKQYAKNYAEDWNVKEEEIMKDIIERLVKK